MFMLHVREISVPEDLFLITHIRIKRAYNKEPSLFVQFRPVVPLFVCL